jgi:hypothetical protein
MALMQYKRLRMKPVILAQYVKKGYCLEVNQLYAHSTQVFQCLHILPVS